MEIFFSRKLINRFIFLWYSFFSWGSVLHNIVLHYRILCLEILNLNFILLKMRYSNIIVVKIDKYINKLSDTSKIILND